MEKVSILLPTRKRLSVFINSINSLYDTANNVDNFEILVALDSDDIESIEGITDFSKKKPNISIHIDERHGYHNLQNYYNNLAINSQGTSLCLWNDDAIMLSNNWDIEILNNHKNFCVLSPKVINMEDYWLNIGVLFPIIPKKWIDLTNIWSAYRGCDSWIDRLGRQLNIVQKIDTIIIKHDRYELTGNNNDETYIQGRVDGIDISNYNEILQQHYNILKTYLDEN